MPGLSSSGDELTEAPPTKVRGRFFWKLYATYAGLVILTTGLVGYLAHGVLREGHDERQEALMRSSCSYLAQFVMPAFDGDVSDREELAQAIAELATRTGHRISLIDGAGVPLVDTAANVARMENHRDRPEVARALEEGTGMATRTSASIREPMLYFAQRVGSEEAPGVVRVSIPLVDLEQRQDQLTRRFLFGSVIGAVAALLLGFLVARHMTRPIHEMTRVAQEMRSGNYDARIRELPQDEFGLLGQALNQLGLELSRRLADVSRDEAQLRAMLTAMVEGVIAVDDSERVVFVNSAARKLLRLGNHDVAGTRLVELVRQSDLHDLITEARTQASARRELVLGNHMRESRLEAEAQAFSAATTRGVVIVLQDITELRRLERVRRDFVANVSHELKTPLTSVRGYVETLLDGAMDDLEVRERFLQKISANVGRLNHLVMDLLSLARIESQQEGLPSEPVALRRLVESVVARHEDEMRAKELDCQVSETDMRVLGDSESIIQVVDNLVTNAIKYTPEGGSVSVLLETRGDRGILSVRDTGIGIPAADRDRIFERFYRVDKARSRELGGTGLGLSIVKHLVQSMDGSVEVESESGLGSCFSVVLPLAQ